MRRYAIDRKKASADYHQLFEDSPTPMYIYACDTFDFLGVNEAALVQYGYSRTEFLQLNAIDIRPKEDIPLFYEINQRLPEAYVDAGRWRHQRKNGERFFVNIYSQHTSFRGIRAKIVLAVNIDKQVAAEQALKEKVQEVEDILESVTDGFYALNERWEFTYINKEFERIMNCKREEVIGKTIWEKFPSSKKLRFYDEYHRAMCEKTSVHFEEYYAPRQVWVTVNAYPTHDGLAVYFVDVTEQKQIQNQLYHEEQNLRAVINNTKDMIWSIDPEMNITLANKAFWERVALITGKPVNQVTQADYDPLLFQRWEECYDRALRGESYRLVSTDSFNGEVVYEETSFNPIFDKEDQVSGISCFSRDITESVNYQKKIEEQNKKLKAIAWIQSHKVRSPVASILGLVQLFNTSLPADPLNAELMTLVRQSATELDQVIREISTHTEELE